MGASQDDLVTSFLQEGLDILFGNRFCGVSVMVQAFDQVDKFRTGLDLYSNL